MIRPEFILEVRKKLFRDDQQDYYLQDLKDFTNNRNKTYPMVVFDRRTLPNILKYRDQKQDFPKI